MQNIPWVEKYRPSKFEDIVLEPMNREIFKNVLEKNYFPNLLFYGPPGTGKTTTIINLINEYQKKYNQINKSSIIHLNASDERGIDIIRNQIYQFVRSKNMFETGLKFVILDEVDYMTKNAQQALKYLLQTCTQNVRFCLICNYICKIDESLKNEFISIRFNQLPKQEIDIFLKHVSESENINLSHDIINTIQQLFRSDIRSMVNFIQLNQGISNWDQIITDTIYENLYQMLQKKRTYLAEGQEPEGEGKGTEGQEPEGEGKGPEHQDQEKEIIEYFHMISIQYNTDKRNILKNYFNYIIRNKKELITAKFLDNAENIVHTTYGDIHDILSYFSHCF